MSNKKRLIRHFIIPTLLQFILLFVIILLFVFFVGRDNGAPLIMASVNAGGEETNPNLVRLLYMIFAFLAAILLAKVSLDQQNSREGKAIPLRFWLSTMGGIMLWQSIGECAWHFGVPFAEATEGFIFFPRLESAAGLMLFAIAFLFYSLFRSSCPSDFSGRIFLLSFLLNWFGHLVLIGTYPFVSNCLESKAWFIIAGIISGGIICLYALLQLRRKEPSDEELYILSLFCYSGIGIIAMGLRGG